MKIYKLLFVALLGTVNFVSCAEQGDAGAEREGIIVDGKPYQGTINWKYSSDGDVQRAISFWSIKYPEWEPALSRLATEQQTFEHRKQGSDQEAQWISLAFHRGWLRWVPSLRYPLMQAHNARQEKQQEELRLLFTRCIDDAVGIMKLVDRRRDDVLVANLSAARCPDWVLRSEKDLRYFKEFVNQWNCHFMNKVRANE